MSPILKCVSLVVAVLLSAAVNGRADETRPNVLFIAIDDLNDMVGFLNAHPGVKTPHMDKLAARGVLFTNAHCAAPGCAASRAALLTGLQPSRTGVYTNRDDWRTMEYTKDVVTLPDSFRSAGYTTRGGGKIYHAYSFKKEALTGYMDPEPWDEYFPSKQQQMPAERTPEEWPVHSTKEFYGGRFDWSPLDIEDAEMADGQVVAWAEQQLSMEHDQPLFLAVGIYRPHVPWWTPEEYFRMHPLDQLTLPNAPDDDLDDLPSGAAKFPRVKWQEWMVENNQWENAVQGYLASMTFADVMVGRLIAALEQGPLADNTVIVLWSDHGYHLGHKKHWEKFVLWEQATHVPLLFFDTRSTERNEWSVGARCPQPASLLDVYPTLAEICKLTTPHDLDGTSLVPLLHNPDQQTGRSVVTTNEYRNHAVRSENWRYIRYADGSEELYDHRVDPGEFTNLAGDEKHANVKKKLSKWLPEFNREPVKR